MNNISQNQQIDYIKFLKLLEKKINEFQNSLLEAQRIDKKHYSKQITSQELNEIIIESESREIQINDIESIQAILPGNPEMVFRLGIEAIRNNVNILIVIEDFCLAQNIVLVEILSAAIRECKISRKITLKNLLKDSEIVEISKKADKTICIGNSNDYNVLVNKIKDLEFYPYNIFDIYSDSEEFDDLKKKIYDYAMENQYEVDFFEDMEFDEVIEEINTNGYGYCSLLLSKEKTKINKFKNEINSKYVLINENPFNSTRFELNLK